MKHEKRLERIKKRHARGMLAQNRFHLLTHYPDSKVELMLRHQTALGLPTDFAKAAEPCDGCMQGGMRKPSVKNKTTAETHEPIEPGSKIFSVVGVDLVDLGVKADPKRRQMGVFACIGAGGCDYSWLYFAPKKSGFVERMLKPFKKMVGTHNRTVGAVQSDAEAVYFVTAADKELRGIPRRSSAPYTKEQNGRIENIIGHLKNKARIFRKEAETLTGRPFPAKAIADSFIVANKMRNRAPTSSNLQSSPHARLHGGALPDFRGENTFMEQAWAHEPKELRGPDNDRKGARCHYLGPSENMKDTDRVIMVKSDGRFGRIVDRYKIKTVSGGYQPARGVLAEGTTIEPAALAPPPAAAAEVPAAVAPDPLPSTATPEVSPVVASPPLVDPSTAPRRTSSRIRKTRGAEATKLAAEKGGAAPHKQDTKKAPSTAPSKPRERRGASKGTRKLRSEAFAKKPRGQLKLDKHRAHLVTHLAGIERRRTASIDGKPVPWSVALLRAEACVATVEKERREAADYLPPTPGSLAEALAGEHAAEWQAAYETEIAAIKGHGTYEPAPDWKGRTVKSKMVFRVTREKEKDGYILKFKARLVAQGFSERYGIDYFTTFAPTIATRSLHVLLHIAAKEDLEIRHIDVAGAYLESHLDTVIYMRLPKGMENEDGTNVVRLIKALYGLKQSGELWYKHLTEIVVGLGFHRCHSDPCVFIKGVGDSRVYLGLYVDDILLLGKLEDCKAFELELGSKVTKIKTGDALRYTGIEINRNRETRTVTLTQGPYITSMVEGEGLLGAKTKDSPASSLPNYATLERGNGEELWSIAGKVRYAVDHSRPEALYIASQLSSIAAHPGPEHPKMVKRLMRYFAGSSGEGLTLGGPEDIKLECWVDASLVEDGDSRSQLGHCWRLNSKSGFCSSKSKRDTHVSLSSAESELRALKNALMDIIWAREFLLELGYKQNKPTKIYEDNQAVIDLMGTLKINQRTKHLTKVLNFTRDHIRRKDICMVKVASADNVADMLTKALPSASFITHKRTLLGQALLE
jgi:hypothetical protein